MFVISSFKNKEPCFSPWRNLVDNLLSLHATEICVIFWFKTQIYFPVFNESLHDRSSGLLCTLLFWKCLFPKCRNILWKSMPFSYSFDVITCLLCVYQWVKTNEAKALMRCCFPMHILLTWEEQLPASSLIGELSLQRSTDFHIRTWCVPKGGLVWLSGKCVSCMLFLEFKLILFQSQLLSIIMGQTIL